MIFAPLYDVSRDADHPETRRAIREFLKSSRPERHSHRGLLLHHILNHCITNKVGFVLEFEPTGGYVIRRRG